MPSMPQAQRRRPGRSLEALAPLVMSTLRQERRAYAADAAAAPKDNSGHLRIASYNIHKGVGVDGRFDPYRIVLVIKEIGADIVALQEADQRFGARAGLLDLALLKRECGLVPVPVNVPAKAERSHGWHGNVVLFREGTVTHARQIALPGVEPRGALAVDLALPAGPLRVIAAHLGLLRRSRAQQVEALLAAAAPADGRPVVLMGDLNEWRLGARSALHGLAPAFGPLHAAIPSFPSRFPVWALDRILGSPHSMIATVERHETPLSRIASDHLPLKAVVNLARAAAAVAA
jgi:endonuclease/exonuclease/phosphatase family metal-dependent hydrolase